MGIPMWAPAPELLAQWQLKYRVMSERTWDLVRKKRPTRGSPLPRAPGASHRHDPNDEFDIKAIAFWIKYADFYEWPHISTFTSFDDLVQQLTDPSLDLRGMSQKVIVQRGDGPRLEERVAVHLREDVPWVAARASERGEQAELRRRCVWRSTARGSPTGASATRAMGPRRLVRVRLRVGFVRRLRWRGRPWTCVNRLGAK